MRIVALLFLGTNLAFAQGAAGASQPGSPAQETVQAQTKDEPATSQPPAPESSIWNRFWVSGQANFIRQQHGNFYAAYSGPNSFLPAREHATSYVLTLYTGFQITKNLEILGDAESTGGAGLSNALGLAGFTNLDVVRNPSLSSAPYMARAMLHWVVPLSEEREEVTRSPLSLFSTLPVRRLEFRIGKMSTADFFDVNTVGSDSHTQFMNWAADNDAAFDYAADTRGYTYGFYMEYDDRRWTVRLGEMLMPTVANGITLDWDIARAGGTNLEFEFHPRLFKSKPTAIRILNYLNRADMGNYREAVNGYTSGQTPTPQITAYAKQGRTKYGFDINVEQYLTKTWEAYGRIGYADGINEDFAYTEADRAVSIGSIIYGKAWHRPDDKFGEAFLMNAISGSHARYLQLGGLGFILGDGNLSYGFEKIFEMFYNAQIWGGISAGIDWQHINDPGYNLARGPVSVISFRIHLEGGVPFDKIGAALH
ncbi:MAG: carbohydrate porin [Acidobacteriaceae bacterium]|nr:carbohydrate porin [Acidobacteriaceae bacterium]